MTTDIDQVATGAADILGEADPEDPCSAARRCRSRGISPLRLPGGQVRGDLALGEVGDQGPQGATLGVEKGSAPSFRAMAPA